MKRIKDVDYVFISARVRAMERDLLTRERMERMLEAPSNEDAVKVLAECGYPELTELTAAGLEAVLAEQQRRTMADLGAACPQPGAVEVFRLKHDYHNAKVLVKAEALGVPQDQLLVWGGRYAPDQLAADYRQNELKGCSDRFCRGIARAREVLGSTGDPQQADLVLDRACFGEMTELARASGIPFVQGYVRMLIDVANLRAVVRASRLEKGPEFLDLVLVEGGSVSPRALSTARGEDLSGLFRSGALAEAAAEGAAHSAPGSGPLTEFERLCDDAVMDYFGGTRLVSFGIEPVIGYLYAREAETTAIRTILSGRMAGLDSDTIRARLRRTYA